jgi:hypothetical protein
MNPVLRIPVHCPLCARELLTKLSVDTVSDALMAGSTIRLHANCHDVQWDANPLEVEQIRQYFRAVGHAGRCEEA